MLVQTPAAPFVIQLPANVPEEAVEDGLSAWALRPHGRPGWLLLLAWQRLYHWSHFRREPADTRSLSAPFQINLFPKENKVKSVF